MAVTVPRKFFFSSRASSNAYSSDSLNIHWGLCTWILCPASTIAGLLARLGTAFRQTTIFTTGQPPFVISASAILGEGNLGDGISRGNAAESQCFTDISAAWIVPVP